MAASAKLPQPPQSHNSLKPRHGVVTLCGYGIHVRVDRGHLLVDDGIGADRRQCRLPRVGHELKRLVVIGADGMISLAALRWLADQDAAFVMLERDGKVLVTTGPVRPSDAKLRRAQSLAQQSGLDVIVARELISQKLTGQERVARHKLHDNAAAQAIADYRLALAEAETVDTIRSLESQGAAAYWAAWRDVQVLFPRKDLPRVPEHWLKFGTRKSLLSGSPRLATNPANAMLNFLYALLESESRLAAAALGLDPGLGILHVDTPARDSLACDLMEAIRPKVDAYVLDWVLSQPLRRDWFFEQRDGNCRLMASFAIRLTETAGMWSRAVGPVAEWVTQQLWSTTRKRTQSNLPPTRLTQTHRREAKGLSSVSTALVAPRLENLCRGCGKAIADRRTHCANCAVSTATKRLVKAAKIGRAAARNPEARAKHAESERRHAQARSAWDASMQPGWLTSEVFSQKIQPLLADVSTSAIRSRIGVSRWYAGRIRQGYRPHPRHWQLLAELVGVPDRALR
ncbi:MAG: CRISPR-associated endonuclease Cas1 [Acidobacteria bacterium]|nr:MAG: CRISPR-associated endonuclease Cas1 [Acidobacteriota bacterium]